MKRQRPDWDFPYEPPSSAVTGEQERVSDVVVAASVSVTASAMRKGLRGLGLEVELETLIDRAPLHWVRVRFVDGASRGDVAESLSAAGLPIRYVASALTRTMALPCALDFSGASRARPVDWLTRRARPAAMPSTSGGQWFLGDGAGVHVDRAICGTAAGTRLAVIDDDAADFEHLELDRVEKVGVARVPAANGHGALMVGWATGAVRPDGTRFIGVAPDASVRVYCTPKAGIDVVSTPLAIARAVFDGADVVVCATYLEATTTPMLDDALEVAARLGRRGRGTVVVMPTGRETSSPRSTVHASLTLALGDPASDPRVHCAAPGGREGGWFLWRSAQGKVRPFSNRGPAVRWLAPGDDIAYPFSSRERLFHAESSGASTVAAGVVLLVLGCNPKLRSSDVHAILERTADEPARDVVSETLLADPADILPVGRDRDGHDAKCGYGRLNARRACASARDPVALELIAMGEDDLALAWSLRRTPYSARLAKWAVRALLARPDMEHALRTVLRHARLVAADPARQRAHAPGALARQLGVILREVGGSVRGPSPLVDEIRDALERLRSASGTEAVGRAFDDKAQELFHELLGESRAAGYAYEVSERQLQS